MCLPSQKKNVCQMKKKNEPTHEGGTEKREQGQEASRKTSFSWWIFESTVQLTRSSALCDFYQTLWVLTLVKTSTQKTSSPRSEGFSSGHHWAGRTASRSNISSSSRILNPAQRAINTGVTVKAQPSTHSAQRVFSTTFILTPQAEDLVLFAALVCPK